MNETETMSDLLYDIQGAAIQLRVARVTLRSKVLNHVPEHAAQEIITRLNLCEQGESYILSTAGEMLRYLDDVPDILAGVM
jgi:hypothetical protein